jgi:hypothetical protein
LEATLECIHIAYNEDWKLMVEKKTSMANGASSYGSQLYNLEKISKAL